MMHSGRWRIFARSLIGIGTGMLVALTGCSISTVAGPGGSSTTPKTPTATGSSGSATATPKPIASPGSYGPQELRLAYQVDQLIAQGFAGKGQTIVDIVSFGDPNIQSDLDTYSSTFGLPQLTVKVLHPLGPNPTPKNQKERADQDGWAGETALDVEVIHALAPEANIVVLTSPVSETEGTVGLPEFRQLIQYAIDNKLGSIISNSWGASEATLNDAAGQAELAKWDALLKTSTTTQGITYFASSGDSGATDAINQDASKLSPTPTTSFVTDSPWVTSVGGTSLTFSGTRPSEVAWSDNGTGATGGGFSNFYSTPSYQSGNLASTTLAQFNNRRGVPDVSALADPATGLRIRVNGQWTRGFGGTSAAAPMWAAIMAIANQKAGRPLGFINPQLYKIAATADKYAADFHDVTQGNNSISAKGVSVKGYDCTVGWDPVTGLGTPNAPKLIDDLIALSTSGS